MSGWFVTDELVPVELETCRCPGSPHDHDTVWLYPKLPADGGIAAMNAWQNGAPNSETMIGILGRIWVQFGVARWNFVDENGAPLPVTTRSKALLDWDAVRPIADKADDLYSGDFLRPLVASRSPSSRNGHTGRSTSRKTASSARPRKP
jgi:hypothetical protein